MNQFFERNYWRRQLIHEAGHAVAALVLLNVSEDIVVMNYMDERNNLQKHARFKYNVGLNFAGPLQVLEKIKILGAGGVAETIYFGDSAQGDVGDMGKINKFMMVPQFATLANPEISQGFPATKQLLLDNWNKVNRIWKKAFFEFKRLRLANKITYRETPVLHKLQIRRLFMG